MDAAEVLRLTSEIRPVPAFIFHEQPGVNREFVALFRQAAATTGGAYLPFDHSSAGQLAGLLGAIGAYAAGGVKALAASDTAAARICSDSFGNSGCTMPQRLQRCRKKGAHLPPGTVCVTQETIWGNEHNWKVLGRTEAVRRFRDDAEKRERDDPEGFAAWLAPLRGKNLACYCRPGEPCHVDLLLVLSNRRDEG